MFELMGTILLAFHLLTVNLACGGPLACCWLAGKETNTLGSDAGKKLAWYSFLAMLLGMVTGGLLLLLPQEFDLLGAMSRFPARAYWFAGSELLVSTVTLWLLFWRWEKLGRWMKVGLAIFSSTNLLYHFPPMMIVIARIAADPTWAQDEIISREVFRGLMFRAEVFSLVAHFTMAALATGGIVLLHQLTRKREPDWIEKNQSAVRAAAGIAFAGTVLQLPIGFWVLISMSGSGRSALMGESMLGSTTFVAGLFVSLYLLQGLLQILLGEVSPKNCQRVVTLFVSVVVLMTATLKISLG